MTNHNHRNRNRRVKMSNAMTRRLFGPACGNESCPCAKVREFARDETLITVRRAVRGRL